MKPRVLAIGAHPDDIEFVMSGTLMWLAKAGYELHYMNLANGGCGSSQLDALTTARIRRLEAQRAASELGATFHESLARDLEIFYNASLLHRLGSVVRRVSPRILLTHSPEDYMEDHMNTCRLAVTAAFSRGMPNFPVDPPMPPVNVPVRLYHAQPHGNCDGLDRPVHPDILVDVTELMERKARLLEMHESQRRWLDESQGMDSYVQTMRQLLREVGQLSGRFEFAEGWRRHSHWGFCDVGDDPLVKALREKVSVQREG